MLASNEEPRADVATYRATCRPPARERALSGTAHAPLYILDKAYNGSACISHNTRFV